MPFAVSFSDLFIAIQYAVFRKSLRTFYVSSRIYVCVRNIYIHAYIYLQNSTMLTDKNAPQKITMLKIKSTVDIHKNAVDETCR